MIWYLPTQGTGSGFTRAVSSQVYQRANPTKQPYATGLDYGQMGAWSEKISWKF